MISKITALLEQVAVQYGLNCDQVQMVEGKNHADFATNLAFKLAPVLRKSPFEVATILQGQIQSDLIAKIDVVAPGFLNFFLSERFYHQVVQQILAQKTTYGQAQMQRKINVEYVSANPTGLLHLGHARNAALGSALVNILRFAGNQVDAEYYINDAGNQIAILGASMFARYMQIVDPNFPIPSEAYVGKEIIACAQAFFAQNGRAFVGVPYEGEVPQIFCDFAKDFLLKQIKIDLANFHVKFDFYTSERTLYQSGAIEKTLKALSQYTFGYENAWWLKTSLKGDDKDRVLVKSNQTYTYFLPDITLHYLKMQRGYDEIINIWGADHIGHIKRMEIALDFLGFDVQKFDVLVVQLVKLFKDGSEVKMSKRTGQSFTLQDLIHEVKVDAARWFMLERANSTEHVFDLDLALKQSQDNPIFALQYAHARACQLLSKQSQSSQSKYGPYSDSDITLIKILVRFPKLIVEIVASHKVHILCQYLIELTSAFNAWYSNNRVDGSSRASSLLELVQATKYVFASGLSLLGISAPEKM